LKSGLSQFDAIRNGALQWKWWNNAAQKGSRENRNLDGRVRLGARHGAGVGLRADVRSEVESVHRGHWGIRIRVWTEKSRQGDNLLYLLDCGD